MSTIQTHSGLMVDPEDIRAAQIELVDIAHSLARIGRFNGHTKEFYSVAQHSVLASLHVHRFMTPEGNARIRLTQQWALLHDAHEAYLGDVPRPLARLVKNLGVMKGNIDALVAARFGLWEPKPHAVSQVDEALLATEKRDLMRVQLEWPELQASALPVRIEPVTPDEAEAAFIARFRELWFDSAMESRCGRCGEDDAGFAEGAKP